jgi:hypothetical protein
VFDFAVAKTTTPDAQELARRRQIVADAFAAIGKKAK